MKLNRKKTRKILLQQLFSSTFKELDLEEFYESFYDDIFSFSRDKKYIEEMLEIIKNNESFFVEIIKKYSPKFNFEKMNKLNIIILYIALSEMFFLQEEIPAKVSINEALELAKNFSWDSAKKLINWILNNVLSDYNILEKDKNTDYKNEITIFYKS